ncbi:MAG: hypothetical protein ABSB75_02020 [Candidatus Limnocylindrales bacterium]
MNACAWCGQPFAPNPPGHGRPRLYCSRQCRHDHGYHVEQLPRWQAELAEAEASAAGWRKLRQPVPVALRNQLEELRRLIGQGPQ